MDSVFDFLFKFYTNFQTLIYMFAVFLYVKLYLLPALTKAVSAITPFCLKIEQLLDLLFQKKTSGPGVGAEPNINSTLSSLLLQKSPLISSLFSSMSLFNESAASAAAVGTPGVSKKINLTELLKTNTIARDLKEPGLPEVGCCLSLRSDEFDESDTETESSSSSSSESDTENESSSESDSVIIHDTHSFTTPLSGVAMDDIKEFVDGFNNDDDKCKEFASILQSLMTKMYPLLLTEQETIASIPEPIVPEHVPMNQLGFVDELVPIGLD